MKGAGAGAGAAVAAVAVQAGSTLIPDSWRRASAHARWLAYVGAGAVSAATLGPWLVLVLLGCGLVELTFQLVTRDRNGPLGLAPLPLLATAAGASGACSRSSGSPSRSGPSPTAAAS